MAYGSIYGSILSQGEKAMNDPVADSASVLSGKGG